MKRLLITFLLFATPMCAISAEKTKAPEYGFAKVWEDGIYRTEFDSPNIGTIGVPFEELSVDSKGGVRILYRSFPNTNAKTNNPKGWDAEKDAVIVIANNDVSWTERCEKSGPPDQTSKIVEVGEEGLFALTVSDDGGLGAKVYSMEVNNDFQPCYGSAPYEGIGVFRGKGIAQPIGFLNRTVQSGLPVRGGDSEVVSQSKAGITDFSVKLNKYMPGKQVGTQPVSGVVHVLTVAEWNGKKFMLFLELFSDGLYNHGGASDWSWPYRQSAYFPGARVVFLSAPALGMPYLQIGESRSYSIDWNNLFQQADNMGLFGEDRLPRDREIPITHFQLSLEISGMGNDPRVRGFGTVLGASFWGIKQR